MERSEELALFVVVHDNSRRCNLATVYNAYRQSPERLDDIVAAHLAALAKVPAVPAPPNAAELRTHLLPMLNQRSRLTSLQQPGLPAPLHRTFPGNLVVTYVFDQPETMAYVNPRMLKTAGATALGVDELHVLAVENLRKRTHLKKYEVHGAGDQRGDREQRVGRLHRLPHPAARTAGRVGQQGEWPAAAGHPRSPNSRFALGDHDPQHVAATACQVRSDAGKMPRPFSSNLLVWQVGQLRGASATALSKRRRAERRSQQFVSRMHCLLVMFLSYCITEFTSSPSSRNLQSCPEDTER